MELILLAARVTAKREWIFSKGPKTFQLRQLLIWHKISLYSSIIQTVCLSVHPRNDTDNTTKLALSFSLYPDYGGFTCQTQIFYVVTNVWVIYYSTLFVFKIFNWMLICQNENSSIVVVVIAYTTPTPLLLAPANIYNYSPAINHGCSGSSLDKPFKDLT